MLTFQNCDYAMTTVRKFGKLKKNTPNTTLQFTF